ncbi:MAG: hypothetical protein Q9216_005791 [Gyalolechia sp. 2 TL-2023]
MSSLLTKSTKGATYLILLQIGSRALTFIVNQVLLRFLSPELLGISTQLELYSITVLFFARESLRVALQRQDAEDREVRVQSATKTKPSQNIPHSKKQDRTLQGVINISYIAIGLGLPLALILGVLYMRSADTLVLSLPTFRQSLSLYALASVLELLSEPCFAVAQQQMLYGVRASAETLATLTRCLLVCGTAIWSSKTYVPLGALPFAFGQIGYAVVLNIVYLACIGPFSARRPYSILIRPVLPPSPSLLWDRLPLPRLNLALNIYAQSIFKHILTIGDSLLIAALASLQSQGAYALASNYGGLVARMIFQPIEESSRSLFGRLLPRMTTPISSEGIEAEGKSSDDREQVVQAAIYLGSLLHVYSLVSSVIVTIGPSFSPLLLRFVAGSRWSDSEAPSVLAAYCYYIPLLAVNGILEAFVSAAATPAQLRVQSAWMIAFSGTFASAGFLVLKVGDQGARGLVLANAVNMICRIIWSWHFVADYFRLRGATLNYIDLMPSAGTMISGFATAVFLSRMEQDLGEGSWHLFRGIIAAGCFGLAMRCNVIGQSSSDKDYQQIHVPTYDEQSRLHCVGVNPRASYHESHTVTTEVEVRAFYERPLVKLLLGQTGLNATVHRIISANRYFTLRRRQDIRMNGKTPLLVSQRLREAVQITLPEEGFTDRRQSFLRFLPLCTASPVAAATIQTASDACTDPSTAGMTSSCWTALGMDDFLSNWTDKSMISNPPMIGTLVCRPREAWASCFVRFAYGQQKQPGPPMDCVTFGSQTCQSPSVMPVKPSSPQYWYGAYAIYAIFTYINTLSSALLATTADVGALQSAYLSANLGAGADSDAYPVDATLFHLLFRNGLTDMDVAFTAYMKNHPYTGDFAGADTTLPSDPVIYKAIVAALQQWSETIMSEWGSFEEVLGTGTTWTGPVQEAVAFEGTMEDVDSFMLVSSPATERHAETDDDPFYDYEQHSTAPRIDTAVVLANVLRRRHPQYTLAVTTASQCNLLGFCNAGKATILEFNPRLVLQGYRPPPSQLDGQEGTVQQEIVFAEYRIVHQDRDFIIYVAECLKQGTFPPLQTYNFILYRGSPAEPPDLEGPVLRELILQASKWTLDLHQEIWIFDQLIWQKSHELWQSAQDSDWDDVILDEEMKRSVRNDIEGFFDERDEYKKFAIPWKRGIIFHGPPGNGKTISIRAIMKELANRSSVPVASLYVKSFTRYNPEYGIRRVFEKARETAPCLLIFEDVDSLVTPSTRSYFLNEVDGLEKNDGVLLLGSTNHLELLDPGISKRPSRFDRKYLYPLPNLPERIKYCQYWRSKLSSNPEIKFPEALCTKIAEITDKFSFAYMKEAFVASLLKLLVGSRGGNAVLMEAEEDGIEDLPLWKEMKRQVELLREELDNGQA